MHIAVVPARNEAGRIGTVLRNLLSLPLSYIIAVINGCTDSTLDEALNIKDNRIILLAFTEPLGIDIPRAVGASLAYQLGATGVVFVDGDMTGDFQLHLSNILDALDQGVDLALVNCYPYITSRQKLTSIVLRFRGLLNMELGLYRDLGLASPTHGPHGISRKLFEIVPLDNLAVPPTVLVGAKRNNLNIKVVTSIPHSLLSSPARKRYHTRMITHTIIGDCLQALCICKGCSISRAYGKHDFDGYHSGRRFDLLLQWEMALVQNDTNYLNQHLLV
jgi:glycosyltransferase involved in cell wall biosynthesis